MMTNRKLSSLYTQTFLWTRKSAIRWQQIVTTFCCLFFFFFCRGGEGISIIFYHLFIQCLPVWISVFGAGDTAVNKWDSSLPLGKNCDQVGGTTDKSAPCHRPENGSQGESQQPAWDGGESRQRGQSPANAE